jgi:HD-like signal output (HDOD) protein
MNSLSDWISKLSDQDMPVFSNTITHVTQTLNRHDSSASDVAQTVLNDPALTSRLLKAVNSIYFNPTSQPINTISRAVMLMGFEQVRSLSLSLMLVDNLKAGHQRTQLLDQMAQAVHAATQAQSFLLLSGSPKESEEIFVATLLSKIGDMAFWAFADEDQAEEVSNALEQGDDLETLIGFNFTDLTKGLGESWALGDMLIEYLDDKLDVKKTACINAGIEIAQLTQDGWDEAKAAEIFSTLADELDLNAEEIGERCEDNIEKAKDAAQVFGGNILSQRIERDFHPTPNEDDITEDELNTDKTESYPEPNQTYQIQVLNELATTLQDKPSIGIVLEMVLEGIYRGVGTDRVLFTMINPLRTSLQCKYALGEGAEHLLKEFNINISQKDNVFSQIVANKQARLIPDDPKALNGTLSRDTLNKLGKPPYMVMPTIVRDKVIGLFIADRNVSNRKIEAADFMAFQQFCQQANMSLTILALQG